MELTEVRTSDSLKFFRTKRPGWEKDHLFCYDLSFKDRIPATVFYQDMMADMQRLFQVSCKTGYREMLCNVVTSVSGSKFALTNLHTTHDTAKAYLFKRQLLLQNATIKDFMTNVLATYKVKDIPWLDESGISFPLDLVINFEAGKPVTFDTVKEKLAEYGIKIAQKIRTYPVMILTDLTGQQKAAMTRR
jgi:hypothetical protein